MNYEKCSACVMAIILVYVFSSSATAGKIYRWVGENGVIGFTDNLSSLPEKYLKTVTPYAETEPGEQATFLDETRPLQAGEETDVATDVDSNGHDEAWWKDRVRGFKARRDLLLQEKERLEEEYNTRYATWLNPFAPGNKNIGEINKQIGAGKQPDPKLFFELPVPQPEITSNLEELRNQIALTEDEIKEIEYALDVGLSDEARQAGALPGWLRK